MSLIYGKTFIAGNAQCRYNPAAISALDAKLSDAVSTIHDLNGTIHDLNGTIHDLSGLNGLSCLSLDHELILSSLNNISSYENNLLSSLSASILNISSNISTLQRTVEDSDIFMNLNIIQRFNTLSVGPVIYQTNVDGWLYCHNIGSPFNVPMIGDPEQYYKTNTEAKDVPILRLCDSQFMPLKSGTKLCFMNFGNISLNGSATTVLVSNIVAKQLTAVVINENKGQYANSLQDHSMMFIPKTADIDFQHTTATFIPKSSYSKNSCVSVDLHCCDGIDFATPQALMVQFDMEFWKEASNDKDVDTLRVYMVQIDAMNSQSNKTSRVQRIICRIDKGIQFVKKHIQFEIDTSKYDSFQMYCTTSNGSSIGNFNSLINTYHIWPFLGLGPNLNGTDVEPQDFNLQYRIVDFFDTYEFTPIGADI